MYVQQFLSVIRIVCTLPVHISGLQLHTRTKRATLGFVHLYSPINITAVRLLGLCVHRRLFEIDIPLH